MPVRLLIGLIFWILVSASSCDNDDMMQPHGDLSHIPYQPVNYTPVIPDGFPMLEQPADNPMTIDGIRLGRKLFYDPILSSDSTMSCFSCHAQQASFTDNLAVSEGVTGEPGKRSSMSLLNVGFYYNGLFWDGRAEMLEDQALLPVEDPVELHANWDNIEQRLRDHPLYPSDFRKAFGIKDSEDITRTLAVKAIAQFERTLISSGNSRFDRFARGEIFLNDSELDGFDMFFDISPDLPDAECGHCHNAPLFTTNEFINNGIEDAQDLEGFPDPGFGAVTGNRTDNGKFRVPSLRNIVYSATYMHDGRFETLEDVLEHYNSGGFPTDNRHPLLRPLNLTSKQKQDIIAFLHTLTDTSFLQNPLFSNPFE